MIRAVAWVVVGIGAIHCIRWYWKANEPDPQPPRDNIVTLAESTRALHRAHQADVLSRDDGPEDAA